MAQATSTRRAPLDRSGTARHTYHADRQTNEYARNSGSTSTSASAKVSPCRLSTPAIRMPTTTHAPRYSASLSGRVRIGCMKCLGLDVHAAHHHQAAQHEAPAIFPADDVWIIGQRRQPVVLDAAHERQDRCTDFPTRGHDDFHAAHHRDNVENRFFSVGDRGEAQIELTATHD